ncbi:HAMP domain-containing sensor histidine kinase [Salinicoccus jeotgali]|uniref:histidine kinase n=1 Tax=Salinicoccus jeotgali TaxID=381634 RepID=A0ABP7F529_9STAP
MLNKLSLKIGMLFFLVVFIVEVILFYILYVNLVDDRVEEVMDDLLSRGNTHRDVLEEHYNATTLEHVAIMESESDFNVVITDQEGDIVIHSNPVEAEMAEVIDHVDDERISGEESILVSDWSEEKYVSTASPLIEDGSHNGHVFMFADSADIKRIIDHLSRQFLFVGLLTIVLTILTVLVLSRIITQPVLTMKKATEQLSRGDHEVVLYPHRKDEFGELAAAITRLSGDLERLKNERNEFLASVSHELRTPLTYLKGYTDILRREDLSKEDRRKYLTIIQEETIHLNGLIKNLFELAKIDQNEFAIKKEAVAFDDLISTVIARIEPAVDKKNIELTFSSSGELEAVVDPKRMQQVFLNILDNAIKYTPPAGRIGVSVTGSRNEIITAISDSGIGIDQADEPYVFERLYRAEKSRSRLQGGAGLGLTIAKEIVELHGGQISVQSTPGEGTVFTVSLERGDLYEECIAD